MTASEVSVSVIDASVAAEQFCYLTTTGRISGQPRTIEIWFGVDGDRIYMLSGGRDRSDWVRNLRRKAEVTVRVGATTYRGLARTIGAETHEDALARRLLVEKYAPGYSGSLTSWGREALPVAVDIEGVADEGG